MRSFRREVHPFLSHSDLTSREFLNSTVDSDRRRLVTTTKATNVTILNPRSNESAVMANKHVSGHSGHNRHLHTDPKSLETFDWTTSRENFSPDVITNSDKRAPDKSCKMRKDSAAWSAWMHPWGSVHGSPGRRSQPCHHMRRRSIRGKARINKQKISSFLFKIASSSHHLLILIFLNSVHKSISFDHHVCL